MVVRGIIKEKPLYLKVMAVILSIIVIVIIFLLKHYSFIIFPIAVILAVFLKKEHIVDETGVNIHYELFAMKTDTFWMWSEIDVMMQNFEKAAPNVMVFFKKNMATRAFVLSIKDAKTLRDFAASNLKHVEVQIV